MKHAVYLLIACAVLSNTMAMAQKKDHQVQSKSYYRYVDNSGKKIISTTLPPQFIKNGYEELSSLGEVLRTVAPAPSEEEAVIIKQQKQAALQQARYDAQLRHRYSHVNDIESVKERTLLQLASTIDILRGNLQNVQKQIDNQQRIAANHERNGQTVPKEVLQRLSDLQGEAVHLQEQIVSREADRQVESDRFDAERLRFEELFPAK